MKSVMQHAFSMVPKIEIQRSVFDRSHGYKTTFNEGNLIPFFVDEFLPGDTFSVNHTIFARLATPVAPVMDNMYLDVFYFAVFNRTLWEHWVNFQGEVEDPNTVTIDYIAPTLQTITPSECQLADYMGLPVNIDLVGISALPFRAYNKIYNEWFRDENLISKATEYKGDGPDNPGVYLLRKRGKRHDYFTSCTKWPQKGVAVELPLGTTAPIISDGYGIRITDNLETGYLGKVDAANTVAPFVSVGAAQVGTPTGGVVFSEHNLIYGLSSPSGMIADLSNATAATINSLRQAFQLQRLYERDARGGTRYCEIIQSHFGVTDPQHAVLQRPVYLGGSSQPIKITPVAQTAPTQESTTPQGNLAAFGTVVNNRGGFSKSFTEHGIVIGIMSVRADLTYQQGVDRMWTRQYREDYYMPVLAHLGEQEVYTREIYAQGTADDDIIFGYQERYAEYRYKRSLITGKMRSNLTDPAESLDYWHLSQNFESRPVLDKTFIEESPPVDRIVAVPSEPHFIADIYINEKCARPMPVYSVPGLVDHF